MLKESPKLDAILKEVNERRVIDINGLVSYKGLVVRQLSIALRTYIDNKRSLPQVALNRILSEALFDRDTGPSVDRASLKAALYRASNRYLNLPLKRHYMLTIWSADLRGVAPKKVRIGECNIRIGNVPSRFHQNDAKDKEERSLHISIPDNYARVITHVRTRCENSAYEEASYQTDVVRGIINLVINFKIGFRETFDGRREPINLVLPGPLHTLHSEDGRPMGDTFWYEMQFMPSNKTWISKEQAEKVNKEFGILLSHLRRSKLASNGKKILISYCRALDNWDWETAFLELWRALEIEVGSPYSYDDLTRRACFPWKNRDIAEAVLEHLKERRNSYVHHAARHADAEGLLFQRKPFVEEMIVMCINKSLKFDDAGRLIEFLDGPSRPDEIIKALDQTKRKLVLLKKARSFKA